LERIRLQAEIHRVQRYKEIALKYAGPYFNVCEKLCQMKLD